ncbi:MAG: SIS domain-containing protein, partial [Clostridiales bacterium]|nr:SIS domain-containing protein [Clostridiales bacterium]
MKKETLSQVKNAYLIESECIKTMLDYFDEDAFSKAVELLKNAERIGASGCGHSGIICQHFVHLMNCIEQPAKFISPAEAVHGGLGFLQAHDVIIFASRGGKTKELLPMLEICRSKKVNVITVTENLES